MAIDFDAFFDSIYGSMAVEAAYVSKYGDATTLNVIPKLAGVVLDDNAGFVVGIGTATPAACVRGREMAEKSLTQESIKGGKLTVNGADWTVKSARPKSLNGSGEFYLVLEQA